MKRFFIIGTDTDVGKTHISCNLIKSFKKLNIRSMCFKPVSSGCIINADVSDDTAQILSAYENALSKDDITLYSFKDAIAPHIAAKIEKKNIDIDSIYNFINDINSNDYDITLIEGAGGLLTPYSETETQLDLIKRLKIPVILISGIKVGCINHTILTINELQRNGVDIFGWIANRNIQETTHTTEQIQTIQNFSGIPLLMKVGTNDFKSIYDLAEILISPVEN
jgi:dethiobiotin synthetase